MKGLECTINGSNLSITEMNSIISNGRNQFEVDFVFDEGWDTLVKYAVFSATGKTTIRCAISDNICLIPMDFLKNDVVLQVGVFGVSEEKTYTTNICSIKVKNGTITGEDLENAETMTEWESYLIEVNEAVTTVRAQATAVNEMVQTVNETVQTVKDNVKTTEDNADICEAKATLSTTNATATAQDASDALTSKTAAQQALADLLAMLGEDIPTLVGGKIPASQMPSLAITEVYSVNNANEMNNLDVQNGDVCVRVDQNKSYIYQDGWVCLASPTDYCESAGTATTAQTAENATMINNKRIVSMTPAQYAAAVINENTFYFVSDAEEAE